MRKKCSFFHQHSKAANRHLKGVLIFRTDRILAQGGASAVVQAETCAQEVSAERHQGRESAAERRSDNGKVGPLLHVWRKQ